MARRSDHDPRGQAPDADLVIERRQQETYRFGYELRPVDHTARPPRDYFAKQAALRLDVVQACYRRGAVLDLCCGVGDYLLPIAGFAERVIGIDFSPESVAAARGRAAGSGRANVRCLVGNARALPLKAGSVAIVCSFSALYHIPRLAPVLAECARVLEPGGVAILEFGLRYSLNTLVCRAYPEQAVPCHLPLSQVNRLLAAAGLTVTDDRAFQILPYWGERPWWLRPLLHPLWRRLMARDVGGRMLDERLSSAPLLRRLAFRHLVVCRKA